MIKHITEEQAKRIIEGWCDGKSEQGIYIAACKENDKYIAIDNSTNECWVEEFRTLKGCKKYLLEFWEYEEVLNWEEENFKKMEIALYIIYYLLIAIFILSSIFLMKKL
ncbi:Gp31 protein [Clostridium perfringens B str. ATCC 3626]|uniref:Gp31 protein n=1 Tax=Clostridium perfringens B str. ATCC 3626 TaxID=451754 RepID=A0AAV3BP44_CLOPF|nr:Gp31 protein [Clostridium perfringens B str. ATCC 3626]